MLQGKIPIQFAFQEEEEEFKDCASLTNNQNELFYEKLTVIPQSGSYIHGRSIDGRPIYFSKKLRMNFRPSEQYRPHLKSLYQTVQSIERNTLRRKVWLVFAKFVLSFRANLIQIQQWLRPFCGRKSIVLSDLPIF